MSHTYRIEAKYPTVFIEADTPGDASRIHADAVIEGKLVLEEVKINRVPKLPDGEEYLRI